ncbi:MAG: tetratricopeptide repeat protein [Saprospiraceae bacterium]|nr:tetratricopeptide repeat protein [Saprospiraceae bacterium]
MQIKVLTIFFILCTSLWLTGQTDFDKTWSEAMEKTTDSTKIDFLLDRTWDYSRMDPNLSLKFLNEMDVQFYKRTVNYKLDVWYYYMGVILKNLGRFHESDEYFAHYYTYHKERGNKRHLAAVQMARANLYADQGLWSPSMEAVTESLNLYETLNDSMGIIIATSKLGAILVELLRIEDALVYHRRSLAIADAINDTAQLAIAHSNIAVGYEKQERYDSSIIHYQKAFELDERSGDEYALIWDRNNLGNIYFKLENIQLLSPMH